MTTKEQPTVSCEVVDGAAHIVINNLPVNALSHGVRAGLIDALERAASENAAVIVLSGANNSFIAGADIREIGKPPKDPQLPAVIEALDQSTVPVVAAIQGHALGGGLEVALACHYRVAEPNARFGLPELKLGIIPGAGGTQRLPRLIGIQATLDFISSGKPIDSESAGELGLIDASIEGDVQTAAKRWFDEKNRQSEMHPQLSKRTLNASEADRQALEKQRARVARKPQVLAPQRLCDAIEAAYTLPFAEGLAKERELFCECRDSPQSAAFRHLFFAERRATKAPKVTTGVSAQINAVGIVGGGTMGRGIAISLLEAGFSVTLMEVSEERVQQTRDALIQHYQTAVAKGRLSDQQKADRLNAIRFVTDYHGLRDMELVIEAVFEDMAVKKQVFAELDRACSPQTILASNTSFQDINALAAATQRPKLVLGLHYFSPANIMKLVEVVRGDATSPAVLACVMGMAKRCDKIPVISGVCYGFIGNRINRRMQQQAQLCLLEGATPSQVDTAMQNFGMAMGPLAVGDLAGLDISYSARKQLSEAEKGDPRTYWIPDRLVEDGRLGQKTGNGYFRYEANSREKHDAAEVLDLIAQGSAHFSIDRRDVSDEEIVGRLLLAVVNEAAHVLQEGIAARASDIDVVYVNGYGFPAYKGGIMYWADQVGLGSVSEQLNAYAGISGDAQLRPAELISTLAASGQGFRDFQP